MSTVLNVKGHRIDLTDPAREGSAPVLTLSACKLTPRGVGDRIERASWRLDGDAAAAAAEAIEAWETWTRPPRVRSRCRVSLSLSWEEARTDGWTCQLHRVFQDFSIAREVSR
jgi:hypothetical protein